MNVVGGIGELTQIGEWLRTGGTIGLLALAVKLYLDNRRLRLAEKSDDRQGYGALIETLTKDVAAVREQHRECEHEQRQLRLELDGLRRQFIAYQLAVAQAVPPSNRTPEIEAMITSLQMPPVAPDGSQA